MTRLDIFKHLILYPKLLLDLRDFLFLKEIINHPEIDNIHNSRNEEHNEKEFNIGVVLERGKEGFRNRQEDTLEDLGEDEEGYFRDDHDQVPDQQLD